MTQCHSRGPERPAMDGRAGLSGVYKVAPGTARMNKQEDCFCALKQMHYRATAPDSLMTANP